MEIKSKIRKMGDDRKVVEIPKNVRDNFELSEEIVISKIKEEGKQ
jgi:hypothetical protein